MIIYNGWAFSDPAPLWSWVALPASGIYAIQVTDRGWRPKPYRPIYFGISDDFSYRGIGPAHHAYGDWVREAGNEYQLWISIHHEDGAVSQLVKEAELIRKYSPLCNVTDERHASFLAGIR